MNINEKLYNVQCQWNQSVLFPYIKNNPDNRLSRPFYFSVTDEYEKARNRIMIVGQETKDFGLYSDDWPMEDIRTWCIDYYRRQMYGIGNDKYGYNRSAFWKLFRLLNNENIVSSWNNIDKIEQTINGKTHRITTDIEDKLNIPFGFERKSLILNEIEISKPKLILFITGPKYQNAMEKSFNIALDDLQSCKPNSSNLFCDITDEVGIKIPAIWTYHPSYLNRIHKIDECVKCIRDKMG